MNLRDFFLMLLALLVGICAISGLVLSICHWRIIADFLRAVFLHHFDTWSSALVAVILTGFFWSAWASRRIHRRGKA